MPIKVMTRGGKVLLKNGKVAVTGEDGKICGPCCGGAHALADMVGVGRCCFTASGTAYFLTVDPNTSFDLPSTGTNSWGESSPTAWNTLTFYTTVPCDGGAGDGALNFGGGASLTHTAGIWTFQEWTTVGGINYYTFNGSSATTTIPNSLVGCGGGNAGFGGSVTVTV